MSDLIVQDVKYGDTQEVLIATPHAVLHHKIASFKLPQQFVLPGDTPEIRRRLTTDIRAMSPDWWSDRVRKLRAHEFYRGMQARADRNKASVQYVACADIKGVIDLYDLDPLLKADHKARNAWLTAMGQNAGMAHEADFRAAREAAQDRKAENERTQQAAVAKERALADAEWGVF